MVYCFLPSKTTLEIMMFKMKCLNFSISDWKCIIVLDSFPQEIIGLDWRDGES